jgi:hypothetical protein
MEEALTHNKDKKFRHPVLEILIEKELFNEF